MEGTFSLGKLGWRSGGRVGGGAGFEGGSGAGDAERWVPPHGVYDVVPQVLKVVDCFFGVEDAAIGWKILELEGSGVVFADRVAEVEAGVSDVKFDIPVLGEEGGGCGVYGGGEGDVVVEGEGGVSFGATGTGRHLHWT